MSIIQCRGEISRLHVVSEINTIQFREQLNTLLFAFWSYLDLIDAEPIEELTDREVSKYLNYFIKHYITEGELPPDT